MRWSALAPPQSQRLLSLALLATPTPMSVPAPIPSLQSRLASTGQAGVLAYGAVNFCYYTCATLLVSSLLRPEGAAHASLSAKARAAALYFSKLSATVWLGSQATKLFRIAAAVFLAPAADSVLGRVAAALNVERSRAFGILVRGILATFLGFYTSYFALTLFFRM